MPAFGQQDSLHIYGELNKDISRASKLVVLPGGNIIWAGEWNSKGILMKVSNQGKEIMRIFPTSGQGSAVRFRDMVLDDDGSVIVAGECSKCASKDSLYRVIVFRVDTGLNVIISKKLVSGNDSINPTLINPSLVKMKNSVVLIATAGRDQFYEDTYIAAFNRQLDTLWTTTINSCDDCLYEFPVRACATSMGFATFVYHSFTDTATIYHFDTLGKVIWKLRTNTLGGVTGGGINYHQGKIYIGIGLRGLPQDPTYYVATVLTFGESDGRQLAAVALNDPFADRSINSIEFAKNGFLIAGYRKQTFSFDGSLVSSLVLRLDLNGVQAKFIDALTITNPDVTTSVVLTHVVPLNDDGSLFAAVGVVGRVNRSFLFLNSNNVATTIINSSKTESNKIQAFPNPVVSGQPIKFSRVDPDNFDKVELKVFDINGRIVQQNNNFLVSESLPTDNLTSGIYILQIKAKEAITTQKLIVQ
ncbi:MAG: T9SS type A sorting domain-containing protein [Saprospiraceae bacterium]